MHSCLCWSAGLRRPYDQSDAIVAGFLYMLVSIVFLCLVVGFLHRFTVFLSRPLCNCLVEKINQGTDVLTHKHTALPASSSLLCRGPLTASCWFSYCFENTRESAREERRNLCQITCANLPFNAQIGQFLVGPISSLFT